MKRVLLSVGVVLVSLLSTHFVVAQAAEGGNKQEMMAKLEKMSAELQLTPEQKKQMLPILMDEGPKLKALKTDTSLGPLQKAMKMREIGQDTDAKVKPILNAQQWDKWQAMRQKEREEMMQKMQSK